MAGDRISICRKNFSYHLRVGNGDTCLLETLARIRKTLTQGVKFIHGTRHLEFRHLQAEVNQNSSLETQ